MSPHENKRWWWSETNYDVNGKGRLGAGAARLLVRILSITPMSVVGLRCCWASLLLVWRNVLVLEVEYIEYY